MALSVPRYRWEHDWSLSHRRQQSRSRWSIGIPQTKCPASKDLGIKLFFERMDVAATITLEKAGFWPLFETANARFPFNINHHRSADKDRH